MAVIKRKNVAIIVETINSYGRGIISGISRYVHEQGGWTIQYVERSLESQPPFWLENWKGDGVIVRDRSGVSCQVAMKTGAKIVDLSEVRNPDLPTIYSDHAMSARMAAEHFLKRHFSHFAFVGIKGRPFSEKRREAFISAVGGNCQVYELKNDEHAIAPWILDNDLNFIAWLEKLPKPVAILACYDLVGLFILQTCHYAGIGIPDPVAVMGINNDEFQCNLANPTLSSVVLDSEKVGYDACFLLDQLMEGKPAPDIPKVVPTVGIVSRRSTDTFVIPDRQLLQAIQYIRDYACDGISVADVAAFVNMSVRTLERRFMQYLNYLPNQEIINAKIKRACELLADTNILVDVISNRVGFQSPSHFTNVFRRETGFLPKEYRKKTSQLID